MNIKKGDWLIIEAFSKPKFGRCISINESKGILRLSEDIDSEGLKKQIPFKTSEILANLGSRPVPGTAYGVKIEPLIRQEDSKFWGNIRYYRWLDDDTKDGLFHNTQEFIKQVKERRLPKIKADLEIRPVSGKMSGYYKFMPTKERDILAIRPNDSLDGIQYIFSHEYAHGLYFRHVPQQMKVKWIQAYHKFVSITNLQEEELTQILDEISGVQSVKEYLKEATEDTKYMVSRILQYIAQTHYLNKLHIELMLNAGESIEEFWPVSLDLTHKELAISEYAKKNVEEFFAESFSFDFVGRTIPKNIKKLLDATLRNFI